MFIAIVCQPGQIDPTDPYPDDSKVRNKLLRSVGSLGRLDFTPLGDNEKSHQLGPLDRELLVNVENVVLSFDLKNHAGC